MHELPGKSERKWVIESAIKTVFIAEENPKTHYFQGDMMLTHHQQQVLHALFNFAKKRSDIENRAMIKDMARLWPGGKVPYAYATDIGKII